MLTPYDTNLYRLVHQDASTKFKRCPSFITDAWAMRQYSIRGGKWMSSADRWTIERYIHVIPFVKSGKVQTCKYEQRNDKATMPLYRLDEKTPLTIGECMKIHDRQHILNMARLKNKRKKKKVDWKKLEFY